MDENKMLVLICLALFHCALAANTNVRRKRSVEYIEEGQDQCSSSDETMDFCTQCSKLPGLIATPLEQCCGDPGALFICQACIFNIRQCVSEAFADSDINGNALEKYLEDGADEDQVDKRYGRLFMNRPSKRYGKLFFGKRNYLEDDNIPDKRYGRLFFGQRNFADDGKIDKRYGKLFFGKRDYSDDGKEKRWGRLFTKSWGRKRWWLYPPYEWRREFQ